MPFRILIVGTDEYLRNRETNLFYEFETGQEAKAYCDARSASDPFGTKFRVKRVLDQRWKTRESEKFSSGHYQVLPWNLADWWRCDDAFQIHRYQYAHPSYKEPGGIAYTATPEQGMDNRKTRVTAGRYLEQFAPILARYGKSAKGLADQFRQLHEPKTLLIADTEALVQWVYENGPTSCMSSWNYRKEHGWGWTSPGKWPNDIHACRMYIAGDLAVAYLTRDDTPKGNIIGRSLIWPAKKTHSRCYGDETRMRNALTANGFTFAQPIGAKLQRIQIKSSRLFVVPYIDAGLRSGEGALAVVDKKTHLEIARIEPKTYPANTTSGACGHPLDARGRAQPELPEHCNICGDHVSDCGDLYQVGISGSVNDVRYWCESCMEGNTYECMQTGRVYSTEQMPPITMYDGTIWSERAFHHNGFVCAGSHGNYPSSDCITLCDGTLWSRQYFDEHGFHCDYSGDAWPNSVRVTLADGHVMAQRSFERHGFVCRDCNRNMLLSDRHGRSVPGEQPQCVRCHTEAVTSTMANDPANRNPRIERAEEHEHE